MGDVVYTSHVRVERAEGSVRLAWLPAEEAPVFFGVHGPVARHYRIEGDVAEPHATTLDYIVAAACG